MTRVLVVGAGVAGTGAALAAARAGAAVTVVDGGTGASMLATGAIDAVPWQGAASVPTPVAQAVRDALDAMGGYGLPDRGARLLTTAGLVRPARGHDAALFDAEPLAGKRVGVVRCDRPGWDADALARAWTEAWNAGTGAWVGVVVDATVIRYADERDLPDVDFAARHDDEARLHWLAERLRAALAQAPGGAGALVLPPSLGVERARARELSALVGVPCGEALASPGGPPGLRFERARDRAFAAAGVERVGARATSITSRETRGGTRDAAWVVVAEDGWETAVDAVVVATGGLIGGGIEYAPGESAFASALPPLARPSFRSTLDAPMTLGAQGRPLELPSTLFGAAPESFGWPFARDPLMQRVGVLADGERDGDGRTAAGLFVAGDLRADRPRTWLDALATGVAAGAAAAQSALSAFARARSSAPALPIPP